MRYSFPEEMVTCSSSPQVLALRCWEALAPARAVRQLNTSCQAWGEQDIPRGETEGKKEACWFCWQETAEKLLFCSSVWSLYLESKWEVNFLLILKIFHSSLLHNEKRVNLLHMFSLGCRGRGERQIRELLVLFYLVERSERIIWRRDRDRKNM